MADDPRSTSSRVHRNRHRRLQEDVRGIRSREQRHSNPHPSLVADKPPLHQGEEAEQWNSSIIGCRCHKVKQGGKALGQESNHGIWNMVPSENLYELWPCRSM